MSSASKIVSSEQKVKAEIHRPSGIDVKGEEEDNGIRVKGGGADDEVSLDSVPLQKEEQAVDTDISHSAKRDRSPPKVKSEGDAEAWRRARIRHKASEDKLSLNETYLKGEGSTEYLEQVSEVPIKMRKASAKEASVLWDIPVKEKEGAETPYPRRAAHKASPQSRKEYLGERRENRSSKGIPVVSRENRGFGRTARQPRQHSSWSPETVIKTSAAHGSLRSHSPLPSPISAPRFSFGQPSDLYPLPLVRLGSYTQRTYMGMNATSLESAKYGGLPALCDGPFPGTSMAFIHLISACDKAIQSGLQNGKSDSIVNSALVEFQNTLRGSRNDEGATDWPLKDICERYRDLKVSIDRESHADPSCSSRKHALEDIDDRMSQVVLAVRSLPSGFYGDHSEGSEQDVCEIRTVTMYTPDQTQGKGYSACAIGPKDGRLVPITLRNYPSSTAGPNTLFEVEKGSFCSLTVPNTAERTEFNFASANRDSAGMIFDNSTFRANII